MLLFPIKILFNFGRFLEYKKRNKMFVLDKEKNSTTKYEYSNLSKRNKIL